MVEGSWSRQYPMKRIKPIHLHFQGIVNPFQNDLLEYVEWSPTVIRFVYDSLALDMGRSVEWKKILISLGNEA